MKAERTIITGERAKQHHPAATRLVVCSWGGESWTRYLILDRKECVRLYRQGRNNGLNMYDALIEATCPYWSAGCGGPGEAFQRTPWVIHNGRRYRVVTQSGGFDI